MSNVTRLNQTAYDILVETKSRENLSSLSDAVIWLEREAQLMLAFQEVAALRAEVKELRHLLEQMPHAGEVDTNPR